MQSGELRRSGILIRLQAQPFHVLALLLEHAGGVVTREELQRRLWGNETTVDFDHSLGTAVNKIREALGDSADNPRFIETLAKRGYRFIAPVVILDDASPVEIISNGFKVHSGIRFLPTPGTHLSRKTSRVLTWIMAFAAGVLLLAASILFLRGCDRHTPPLRIRKVTYSGRVYPGEPLQESLAPTATDGTRIYFAQIENGRAKLAQALIGDGEAGTLPMPSAVIASTLYDLSRDGSKMLVRNELPRDTEEPLWVVSTIGEAARQVPNILAHDASWMPDGKQIVYANGTDLIVANEDGLDRRKLASLSGRAFWLRWSPDGKLLRFTLMNTLNHVTSLWTMSADGKTIRPLLPDWSNPQSECCGSWTADGRYFVFQSAHNGLNNIWALDEGGLLHGVLSRKPFQVTDGPLSYQSPITAPTGHQLLFIGLNTRSELLQFDPASRLFLPHSRTLNSAQLVEFSRDGQFVAWISLHDSTLWRSRTDGTQRLQLAATPMEVFAMHWSADGKRLVLMGREPGKLWRLYLVDANGGDLHPLLNENRNEGDPSLSPDGNLVVFGRLPDVMAERTLPKAIYILDMKAGTFAPLPQSEGLFSPRWSPDGRYIAAMPLGQRKLMLFDRHTSVWKTLVDQSAADPVWSHDGHWIYFHDFLEESQAIYRASVPDGRVERIAGLGNLQSIDIADFRFVGLAPGDLPLIRARMSTANIYSADLDDLLRRSR
jgi:Tol biopolymer transport system component/DNA-binding winged helix-turn-helix (wHTH) protein